MAISTPGRMAARPQPRERPAVGCGQRDCRAALAITDSEGAMTDEVRAPAPSVIAAVPPHRHCGASTPTVIARPPPHCHCEAEGRGNLDARENGRPSPAAGAPLAGAGAQRDCRAALAMTDSEGAMTDEAGATTCAVIAALPPHRHCGASTPTVIAALPPPLSLRGLHPTVIARPKAVAISTPGRTAARPRPPERPAVGCGRRDCRATLAMTDEEGAMTDEAGAPAPRSLRRFPPPSLRRFHPHCHCEAEGRGNLDARENGRPSPAAGAPLAGAGARRDCHAALAMTDEEGALTDWAGASACARNEGGEGLALTDKRVCNCGL